MSGAGLCFSTPYMDITIPGEQNPHWEPWPRCSRSWHNNRNHGFPTHRLGLTWTGWRPRLVEPRPSTVVTCAPWQLASGTLHEVTVTSSSLGSPPPSLPRS